MGLPCLAFLFGRKSERKFERKPEKKQKRKRKKEGKNIRKTDQYRKEKLR